MWKIRKMNFSHTQALETDLTTPTETANVIKDMKPYKAPREDGIQGIILLLLYYTLSRI